MKRVYLIFYFIIFIQSYQNRNELKNELENVVNKMSQAIRKIYQKKCEQSTFDCQKLSFDSCLGTGERNCLQNYPLSNMCSGKSFYSSVSVIKKPNFYTTSKLSDDNKFFICKTGQKQFQSVMQSVMDKNNKTYAWYYFGSSDGLSRMSPGMKSRRQSPQTIVCENQDVRLRPWYSSNVYNPKNIIIIIQNSNLIRLQYKKMTMQKIILSLLKTSQPQDMINIIQFSDTSNLLFSNSSLKLFSLKELKKQYSIYLQNNKNKSRVLTFQNAVVANMTFRNSSERNYQNALQLATLVFNNSKKQTIFKQNIILMITGNQPSVYESSVNKSIEQFLAQKQKLYNMNYLVFGFGLNITRKGQEILKTMACTFQGIYFDIGKINYETEFLNSARGYFQYLNYGNEDQGYKWTEMYQDNLGLGWMTTVVQAVYYKQNGVKRLIGVAGLDVLRSQIYPYIMNSQDQFKNFFVYMPQHPFQKMISQNPCYLQKIRQQHRCNITSEQKICTNVTKFCQSKIINSSLQIFRDPLDITNSSCCNPEVMSESGPGLAIWLTVGLVIALILIGIIGWFVFKRYYNEKPGPKQYKDIFDKFADFDQSRVRPQSQISMIKQ